MWPNLENYSAKGLTVSLIHGIAFGNKLTYIQLPQYGTMMIAWLSTQFVG